MTDDEEENWDADSFHQRLGLGSGRSKPTVPLPSGRSAAHESFARERPVSENYSTAYYLRSTLRAKPKRDAEKRRRSALAEDGSRVDVAAKEASSDSEAYRHTGLGSKSNENDYEEESDDWDPEGDDSLGLPESFGGGARTRRKRRRRHGSDDEGKLKSEKGTDVADVDVETGEWERHTKGIGSKLLQKMGFTGRLGLREDGIAKPIAARVRPEKAGIGATKFVEKTEEEEQMDLVMERNQKTGIMNDSASNADGDDKGKLGREAVPIKRWQKRGADPGKFRRPKRTAKSRLQLVDLTGDSSRFTPPSSKGDPAAEREVPSAQGVLDLRGPVAISRGSIAEALLAGNDVDEKGHEMQGPFDVPEVVYNVRLLHDSAEADVEVASRKRATEELLKANASSERNRISDSLDEAKCELERGRALQAEFERFVVASKDAEMYMKTLKKKRKSARQLRQSGTEKSELAPSVIKSEPSSYIAECARNGWEKFVAALNDFTAASSVRLELQSNSHDPCGIRDAVSAIVEKRASPVMADLIETVTSSVLEKGVSSTDSDDVTAMAENLKDISCILASTQRILGGRDSSDKYMRLVCRILDYPLRRAIGTKWDARHPDAMVELFQGLKPVMPSSMLANIVDEVLVARLSREVDAWSWLTRSHFEIPLHFWIFPWLPVIGKDALAPVLSIVRQKLSTMLRGWTLDCSRGQATLSHVSPSTVAAQIRPWTSVLSKSKLQGILSRHLVPFLESSMTQYMEANALSKHTPSSGAGEHPCEILDEVLVWCEIVSGQTLGAAILSGFFPGLLRALHNHLFGPQANPDELSISMASSANWYDSWRNRLPISLLPYVRSGLASLLFLIHTSSKVGQDAAARRKISNANVTVLLQNGYIRKPLGPFKRSVGARQDRRGILHVDGHGRKATLKEVVRSLASREGLAFHDDGRKTGDGRQLFVFGKASIVLDGSRQLVLADLQRERSGGVDGRLVAVDMDTLVKLGRGDGS